MCLYVQFTRAYKARCFPVIAGRVGAVKASAGTFKVARQFRTSGQTPHAHLRRTERFALLTRLHPRLPSLIALALRHSQHRRSRRFVVNLELHRVYLEHRRGIQIRTLPLLSTRANCITRHASRRTEEGRQFWPFELRFAKSSRSRSTVLFVCLHLLSDSFGSIHHLSTRSSDQWLDLTKFVPTLSILPSSPSIARIRVLNGMKTTYSPRSMLIRG